MPIQKITDFIHNMKGNSVLLSAVKGSNGTIDGIPEMSVTYVELQPGEEVKPHTHNRAEVYVFLTGRAKVMTGSEIKEVTTGLKPPPQYFPNNVRMNKSINTSIDEILHKGTTPLDPPTFKELSEKKDVLVVDTRSKEAYTETGTVPGAWSATTGHGSAAGDWAATVTRLARTRGSRPAATCRSWWWLPWWPTRVAAWLVVRRFGPPAEPGAVGDWWWLDTAYSPRLRRGIGITVEPDHLAVRDNRSMAAAISARRS